MDGDQMKKYLEEAKALVESFTTFEIEVIPREANREAVTLSKYIWQLTQLSLHFVERVTQPCACECFNLNKPYH